MAGNFFQILAFGSLIWTSVAGLHLPRETSYTNTTSPTAYAASAASSSVTVYSSAAALTTSNPFGWNLHLSPTLDLGKNYSNSTCKPNCAFVVTTSFLSWIYQSTSATITAATLVYHVHNGTNATSTQLIANPSAANHTNRVRYNEAGTRVTTFVTTNPGGTPTTTIITFPTQVVNYPWSYYIYGSIPTTINGRPTCASGGLFTSNELVFTLPSHPVYTAGEGGDFTMSQSGNGDDMIATWVTGIDDTDRFYNSAFEDVYAMQHCSAGLSQIGAFRPVQNINVPPTVALTTLTSTSHHATPWTSTAIPPVISQTAEPQQHSSTPQATGKTSSAGGLGGVINSIIGADKSSTEQPYQNTPSPSPSPSTLSSSGGEGTYGGSPASTPAAPGTYNNPPPASSPVEATTPYAGGSPIQTTSIETTDSAGSSTTVPGFVVGTQSGTIGQTITVSNTPVVVQTSGSQTHAVVGSSTIQFGGKPTTTSAVPVVIGISTHFVSPGSTTVVQQGGSSVAIGITTNSQGSTVAVIGGSTSILPPQTEQVTAAQPATVTLGGETITQDSSSNFVVGGTTLTPGSSITVGSGSSTTVVGVQTNAFGQTVVIVGSQQSTLPAGPATTMPPALTIGGQTVTPNSASQFVVGGKTLSVGGSVILGSGSSTTVVVLSTDSKGFTELVVGSSTSTLSPSLPKIVTVAASTTSLEPLTINGQTITANSASGYVISSQTLSVGHPITIGTGSSKTVLSLSTSGSSTYLVIPSSTTSALPVPAPSTVAMLGETITLGPESSYMISGTTLTPGQTVTLSGGDVVELSTNSKHQTIIVVGGSSSTKTTTVGGSGTAPLASYIYNGIGVTPTESTAASSTGAAAPSVTTGAASRIGTGKDLGIIGALFAGFGGLAVLL